MVRLPYSWYKVVKKSKWNHFLLYFIYKKVFLSYSDISLQISDNEPGATVLVVWQLRVRESTFVVMLCI